MNCLEIDFFLECSVKVVEKAPVSYQVSADFIWQWTLQRLHSLSIKQTKSHSTPFWINISKNLGQTSPIYIYGHRSSIGSCEARSHWN